MTSLTLDTRSGLPDALRILIAQYPREAWEKHPNFSGLVQFWLERHMMFRKLTAMIEADTAAAIDRRISPDEYRARLSRFASLLLGQLHEHHTIEDTHYFPQMSKLDKRLEHGFGLLDADHHQMDTLMQEYATTANAVLAPSLKDAGLREQAGAFAPVAGRFGALILRHLEDEEDLIVPILLHHGAPGM